MSARVPRRTLLAVAAIAAASWCAVDVFAQPPPQQEGNGSAAATPRLDGHPDLSGFWVVAFARDVVVDEQGNITANGLARGASPVNSERDATLLRRADLNRPVYKSELWEKVQQLDYDGNAQDPAFSCMPPGVPRIGPPSKIVQTANEVVFLYQTHNLFRLIPTNRRAHDPLKSQDPTLMGDSIGQWEGDTLVIDTIGFTDSSWLDIGGYIHSTDMHVTERVSREGNTLRYQTTVEDPTVLEKPWVRTPVTLKLNPNPNDTLWEDPPCIERDLPHLVTKEHH